jgi:hypothetical protein
MKKVLMSLALLFALSIGKVAAQAKATVLFNGKRVELLNFGTCAEYKKHLIDNLGEYSGTVVYDADECQDGMVRMLFPNCVGELLDKQRSNPDAIKAYYIELKKIGDAAFCKKYAHALQQAAPMKQDKVKKQ